MQEEFNFGVLRTLLTKEPSIALWRKILRGLESLELDDVEQTYLPYLQSHLQVWPPGLRSAPNPSKLFFFAGPDRLPKKRTLYEAILPLLDCLEIAPNQDLTNEDLFRLSENPLCAQLHTLKLRTPSITRTGFQSLAASECFPKLEHYLQNSTAFDRQLMLMFGRSNWFTKLNKLELESFSIEPGIDSLFPAWPMETLKHLSIKRGDFVKIAEAILRGGSGLSLESLHLYHLSTQSEQFAHMLNMPSLKSLHISPEFVFERHYIDEVLKSSYPSLEEFRFKGGGYYSEDYQRLLLTLEAPNLKRLQLSNSHQTPVPIGAMRSRPFVEHLEELNLNFSHIGDRGLSALGNMGELNSIKELHLRGINCKGYELHGFLQAPHFGKLELLDIGSNRMSSKYGAALAHPHKLQNLQTLSIGGNEYNDELVLAIVSNQSTPQLTSLSVYPNSYSIPVLYTLSTMGKYGSPLRYSMLQDLVKQYNKAELVKLLKAHIKRPDKLNRGEINELVIELLSDEPLLLDFLCSEEYVRKLTVKAKKATLRALGVKGYSSLARSRLHETTMTCLQAMRKKILDAPSKAVKRNDT